MKRFEELTDDEIFEFCANKSIDEIKEMEDEEYKAQAIRYYLSRLLMDYTDENPLQGIDICVDVEDSCGLSTLQMPHIISMCQSECDSGTIWFLADGGDTWTEIDMFTTNEKLGILIELSNFLEH